MDRVLPRNSGDETVKFVEPLNAMMCRQSYPVKCLLREDGEFPRFVTRVAKGDRPNQKHLQELVAIDLQLCRLTKALQPFLQSFTIGRHILMHLPHLLLRLFQAPLTSS